MKRSNLFFALLIMAALVFDTDLSAQRRGGGGSYGGGNRNVRSSANSSVNRNFNQNANVNRNANVNSANRNVNVNNVNRNVNVNNGYHGGYYGGGYYGGGGCCYHPVATAAAVTATAGITAAVVGSIVDRPPAGCVSTVVSGQAYQQCGNTWYQPQMSGTTTTYEVVNPPR
jgi:hypothetical protein